jgi:type II secretory ATPase GspE/PulE/Tfp pilus assembly ATPase PilB-like protein
MSGFVMSRPGGACADVAERNVRRGLRRVSAVALDLLRRLQDVVSQSTVEGAGPMSDITLGVNPDWTPLEIAWKLPGASGPREASPTALPAPRPVKFDYLVAQRFVTRAQLAAAIAEARDQLQSVEALLIGKYGLRKSDVGVSLSLFYKCPFLTCDTRVQVPLDLLKNLTAARLKAGAWIPVRREDDVVTIAMKDPHDLPVVDGIERTFAGQKVKLNVALHEDIVQLIEASFGATRSILGDWAELKIEAVDDADEAPASEINDADNTVIRLAQRIILDAYRERASDIHVEPCNFTRQTAVRFRVDGTCTEYERIPAALGRPLVARFKIMANLDIAERRMPQDGKLRAMLPDGQIELRVATIPTVGGHEDVILRLLPSQGVMPLERQGLSDRNLRELKAIAQKPYGLILCVGPTGSGKTTTLHAVLKHINTPERKIWTAEDPVEITQPGLRQVNIRPKIGYTFAAAMRAFLRGDPDVIMVGEMRDSETAAIAIEASLTGHLVLSTLHTNSAAESIVRLLEMGLDSFNFADALLGVLGQRLVKRVCTDCAQAYTPSADEIAELVRAYGEEDFAALGIPADGSLELEHGKGCDRCRQTGYRGRAAIHELLIASDEIKAIISARGRMPDIVRQARQEGMSTLMQDGIRKVLAGVTDLRQVRAVAIR